MTPFETRCSLSNCATIRSRHILLFPVVVVVVIYTNVRENYHISHRIACYMSFDGKLEFSIYEFGTYFSKSMAWIECKLSVVRSINYRQWEEKLKYYRKRIYRWFLRMIYCAMKYYFSSPIGDQNFIYLEFRRFWSDLDRWLNSEKLKY